MTTALIIEDDDNNMLLTSMLLAKAGYRVQEARSGEEGVALALEVNPGVVILDIKLPDMDGYEVLRRIRQSPADGTLPIIAMTSYAMSGDRERLLAAGCDGYLEKPIDPAAALAYIQEVVGAKT